MWTLLKRRCLLSTVMYVVLWSILPNSEGKGRDPGVKVETVDNYRGKAQDWKKATLQSLEKRALQRAPCFHPCVTPVMLPWHWLLL